MTLQVAQKSTIHVAMDTTTREMKLRIKRAILNAGISQNEVARLAGYTRSTMSSIVNPGNPRQVTVDDVKRIAAALKCKVSDLMDEPQHVEVMPLARELVVQGPLDQSITLTLDELVLLKLIRASGLQVDEVTRRLGGFLGNPRAIVSGDDSQPGKLNKPG